MSDKIQTYQERNLPLLATIENCKGGTFIVTGANTGLGLEAARHLVSLGATRVVMACRSVASGEAARADIESSTGVSGVAQVWELDLSNFDSVKAFAKRAVVELDRIDAVIENAAVASAQTDLFGGFKLALAVNVIGTFLLAVLLLPKLSESANKFQITPRLTVVTSRVSLDFEKLWHGMEDDPLGKANAMDLGMAIYPISKLLEIMPLRYLAKSIPVSRTGVIVNLVCPGLCKTSLSRGAPAAFREDLAKKHAEYGRTAEDGSRTLLHGAVAGKESHGCLLHSCRIGEADVPDWVDDEAGKKSQELAWKQIAKELDTLSPGCVEKILG